MQKILLCCLANIVFIANMSAQSPVLDKSNGRIWYWPANISENKLSLSIERIFVDPMKTPAYHFEPV
jgi:hypothetical protein